MGQKLRHFGALMKKNWIIWKRTLGASLCELFCPVALMAILAVVRALVSYDTVEAKSNISLSTFFSPLDYLLENNTSTTPTPNYLQYQQFLNFSGLKMEDVNPLVNFFPTACLETDNSDARPVIAFSGFKNITQNIIRNIQFVQKMQLMHIQLHQNTTNETIRGQIEAFQRSMINFTFTEYPSHNEILDYIKSSDYMIKDNHPGVCYAFSVVQNSPIDYETRLIFNDHEREPDAQMIPQQLYDIWSMFQIEQDRASYKLYTKQGYSYLQNWIANEVLKITTKNGNASIAMTYVPFKSDKYISDDFKTILSNMLSFFMLLMYILPVYRLISNLVAEKESKARESMKMMGLSDASYWLSWFTYYTIIVTIISILCLIVLQFNVFKNSNKGIIFLYFWVYGMSLFGLCVLLQSFFSSARIAAITGTLVYFGTSFIDFIVRDPLVSMQGKNVASLLATVAVSRGSQSLSLFETNGMGLTVETMASVYQNYRFQDCLILMAVSFILSFWFGIYLDNVLPSAFGLRKPWYFCLSRSYWLGARVRRERVQSRQGTVNDDENSENLSLFESKNRNKANFEPPSREMIGQENDGKILKISELKKTFTNGFQAVKGVNIKMYNGQIFALLGHNGAGKTTTISMLTGLIEASSGAAEVFGHDLFNDMNTVRNFLGVCPQHDILFDLLTPEEHLDIFCDFKGVDKKTKKEEIQKMLVDIDLFANKDTEAKNLSGGNRRKLSVAIAMIGGSKLVLLDEPTSGMDLSARRKLWTMLKNYKHNRIIILTTHYMDEADILGDRIGIMTGGQLICLGSSLFLKNRFGVGYNLTMVKQNKDSNTKVGKYLEDKIGEVRKLSEISSEITYQIPTALSYKFKDFFVSFDQDLEKLDIRSYGISVTTLEEVFLRVGHGDDTDEDKKVKEELKKIKVEGDDKNDNYSVADDHETGIFNVFWINMDAMFRKRMQLYKRNYKGLFVEVFIPVILVLIGFGFSKVRLFADAPERTLAPAAYPWKQRILVNQDFIVKQANDTFTPKQYINQLPSYNDAFDATYGNFSQSLYPNQSAILTGFDDAVFLARLQKPYEPFRFASYFMYEADRTKMNFKVSNFINLTSQDVAAYYPEFMYESILKVASGNTNFKFKVITSPYPVTQNLRQRAQNGNGVFIVFVVAIGFAMIPASIMSFLVNEREKQLKHMQLVSGMSLAAYWISNICFDIVKAIIPSVIVIGLMYAFELQYNNVWIMFLIFPVGVVPFTYATSFCFTSENLALTITIFLHFVIAGIGAIAAAILRLISSTYIVGDVLVWVFKIVPTYCLTDSILYSAFKAGLFQVRPDLIQDDLAITAIGGDILVMFLHGIFWTFILILIEVGAFNCFGRFIDRMKGKKIAPRQELSLDIDVIEEENRVESTGKDQLKVRVNAFRKVYSQLFRDPYVAVEKTSFGLDYGECFALLGVNGAGKTTTFKSLTGGIIPTSGEITINGLDIQRNFAQVRKLIGYCPQHDAIFPLMSVLEHLQYYARIKGIRKDLRNTLIEKQIKEMNLEEHRNKPAGTLSGGNKRKLSVAMCVIGNPPIILLDEPSAGMDPEARRFMWSVVAKISQQRKKSAVILTTHSMEEAEALSTKMGIMVKGGIFRCFGSSQHIKNKFGTGYEIEVKVRKQSADELRLMTERFGLGQREVINFEEMEPIMRSKMVDEFLVGELKYGGLGNDLCIEADEHKGIIETRNFINWIYVEEAGLKIIEGLCDDFEQVDMLEHYNDYYKMRVPRGDKSIGFVFSLIESKKEVFNISEYSASQTTLEQIFQTFANLQIDAENLLKFHKVNGQFQRIKATQTNMAINEGSNEKQNYYQSQ